MSPSATITIHPATEGDLRSLIPLQFRCFCNILIEQITSPDTPATRAATLENHYRHMREDHGLRIVKAVAHESDDAGREHEELVGFSMFYVPVPVPVQASGAKDNGQQQPKWIYPTPLRPAFEEGEEEEHEVLEPVSTGTPAGPGGIAATPATANSTTATQPSPPTIPLSRTNIPTLRPHRKQTLLNHIRRTFGSTAPLPPVGYVRYMCVHPLYRRHGIGAKLMAWGCRRFDELGVPAYLEASVEGEPLYRRFGFEEVGVQVLEVYGENGEVVGGERYKCMWRDPERV